MKKVILMLTLIGFAFAVSPGAYAGPKDCKATETWNEKTKKCDPKG